MKDTIEALVELQQVDDEVRSYRLQRDELSANLDRLKTILTRMSTELEDKREKLAEATRFYEEKQQDLQIDADRLGKAKAKLAAVTRTKEYAAMQREMETLRKKYSDDEQELKRLAEHIEEYKQSIGTEEGKLAELEAEVAREEASSADRLEELSRQIDAIAGRKDAIVARLDRGLVSRYNRILPRREGKAVVAAVDGNCSGCQMKLPPQTYILVQRGESLQTCPSCQRFLFYVESADTAESAEA